MDKILGAARALKFASKTDKSFLNILTGAKTHQTYFDAVIQQMLPFYHIAPNLKHVPEAANQLELLPYFYDSSVWTFNAVSLYTQVLSAKARNINDYLPVSNQLAAQQHVKHVYQKNQDQAVLKDALKKFYSTFENPVTCYELPDGTGNRMNPLEVMKYLGLSEEDYKLKIFIERNSLTHFIKTNTELTDLYIRMPLHSATQRTYGMLNFEIGEIAKLQRVKQHTIEDHITEILIKDYPLNLSHFITFEEYEEIRQLYETKRFERLKPYFEHSSVDEYFKIKLALIAAVGGREWTY